MPTSGSDKRQGNTTDLDLPGEPVTSVPGPSLTWSIKRSLLRYIASMPDGRCSVTDGAEVEQTEGTSRFSFEFERLATRATDFIATFRGDVRFSGHHGMLFIRLADPEVVIGADGRGTLSVPADATETTDRISLVQFVLQQAHPPLAAGLESYEATSVRLTAEGADLFGGVYGDAEPFDKFNLTLPATGHAMPFTQPADTGSDQDTIIHDAAGDPSASQRA